MARRQETRSRDARPVEKSLIRGSRRHETSAIIRRYGYDDAVTVLAGNIGHEIRADRYRRSSITFITISLWFFFLPDGFSFLVVSTARRTNTGRQEINKRTNDAGDELGNIFEMKTAFRETYRPRRGSQTRVRFENSRKVLADGDRAGDWCLRFCKYFREVSMFVIAKNNRFARPKYWIFIILGN